jgi:Dihaem cytochrome c.
MRTFTSFLVIAALATTHAALAADVPAAGGYAAECGSCHVAYPARLLDQRQWGRVLGDLEHHYGVDATLDDDAALHAVARTLGVPAALTVSGKAALPRITTQPWFVDEHDEVGPATFRSSKVRSAANCSACHVGAEQGNFDEDAVRIPR